MSFTWNCHAVDSAISSGDRCDTGTAFRGGRRWRGGEWRRWGTRRSTRRSTKALGSVLVMRVWLGEFAHFFVGRVCLEINKHMRLYITYIMYVFKVVNMQNKIFIWVGWLVYNVRNAKKSFADWTFWSTFFFPQTDSFQHPKKLWFSTVRMNWTTWEGSPIFLATCKKSTRE